MEAPQSCDTFVVLPPLTENGVVFGKNSDRPQGEIQEVIYMQASEASGPTKCTYIEVDSVEKTKAIILSKPNWMWGAEMGANECGVAIGNEAIWTNDNEGDSDPSVKRLLGMDLVRLGLERSASADEALDVITKLLETYGQGGPCSKEDDGFAYHNSFLIADRSSAWVLETCGKHWVAEKINSGFRNISNVLTITTKIDRKSEGLEEYAKSKNLWDGNGEFNFCEVFSGEKKPGDVRFIKGGKLLEKYSSSNSFRETDMFKVLRDKDSGVCRDCDAPFPTAGSQVSTLTSTRPSVHWFTATPDPSRSVFKPFIFTKNAVISKHTICPDKNKMKTEEKNNIPKVRIAVIGKSNVGKSALTVRYLTRRYIGEYRSNTDLLYRQTLTINNTSLEVEIVDVCSCDLQAFPEEAIYWADAAIVVYDITCRDSFNQATDMLQRVLQLRTQIPTVLLGNKADLEHLRQVEETEGRTVGIQSNCTFYEVSVAENSQAIYQAFDMVLNECRQSTQKTRKFSVSKMIGTLIGNVNPKSQPETKQGGTVVVCHKSDLYKSRVIRRRQNFTATASL